LQKLTHLLNLCVQKNIPFVSFRLPNEKKIQTWIQISGKFNFFESIHEVEKKAGFVYAPFHRKTNFPIVYFEPELILENENFEISIIDKISEQQPMYPVYEMKEIAEISKGEYLQQANLFIDSFDEKFQKAILSRVHLEKKPKSFEAGKLFIKLQETYPNAFCHLINIPGAGVWAGASPETLLRIDKNKATTISLAGTKAKSNTQWTEKELEEQKIVTDYIENTFAQFGIVMYDKENNQNHQAGNLFHLATKFSFHKKDLEKKLTEFISGLHPTPAICGLPKEKALDLILQTEKHNREYYAGFCGTINIEGQTDLFVNLRCMKILPDQLALYVGGGITKSSVAEKEWEETVLKANTLLSVI